MSIKGFFKGALNRLCRHNIVPKSSVPNYCQQKGLQRRTLHFTNVKYEKKFYEAENAYIYQVVPKGILPQKFLISKDVYKINSEAAFNEFLNKNWRNSNSSNIVDAFKSVEQYCIDNVINVADPRFDRLVDGLMDHCDKLTDNELLELLTSLSKYPVCSSYKAHNYHDVWSCLDDICCWRMGSWDIDTIFDFADIWYELKMGRVCDYVFLALDKLTKKAGLFTKDQLVRAFFQFNVCRRRPVDFEYEAALENKINEMNIDEMAVVALGYFKSKSKIKILSIQQAMVEEVTKKSLGIHEITLTAIMKVLRLSNPTKLLNHINKMLDSLCPELNRLSEICCLHISLLSTGLQAYHPETLRICAVRLAQVLPDTRLKDIERILNVLTMFNFHPQAKPDIFELAFKELHKDNRIEEINRYPRCLPSALNYLSLREIYSYELMNRVLDVDFIYLNYGKHPKFLPRDVLSLDACIDIECPGYVGNRLPPHIKYKAVKWHTEFSPLENKFKKPTAIDRLMLDALEEVQKIVKTDDCILVQHVLPHFPKADIVICKDTKTGEFIKPIGFERYILGDVMHPFKDENLKWYSIVIVGWNNTIRETTLPLGHTLMKERHLKKIGYNPILVIWNHFMRLSSREKDIYLKNKLR